MSGYHVPACLYLQCLVLPMFSHSTKVPQLNPFKLCSEHTDAPPPAVLYDSNADNARDVCNGSHAVGMCGVLLNVTPIHLYKVKPTVGKE
jgi:hypothetical protein